MQGYDPIGYEDKPGNGVKFTVEVDEEGYWLKSTQWPEPYGPFETLSDTEAEMAKLAEAGHI